MIASWPELTGRRAVVAGLAVAVVSGVLLTLCNPDDRALAITVAAAASAPLAILTRWPWVAVAASGAVAVLGPLLVECSNVLVYPFVAVLIVFVADVVPRPLAAFGFGLVVLAVHEVLTEAADLGAVSDAAGDSTLLATSLLEAAVLTALVVGWGYAVAETRRQAAAMVELQQANAAMALTEQRQQIARDLHDVAAHHLSSIVVRARTAAKLGDQDSLGDAARFAGDEASHALDAMRQIVSVLRTPYADAQPSLADLETIVATTAGAGVEVTVTVDEEVSAEMNRPCELAVVRIVQEALSNVVRHSEATRATVEVGLDDGGGRSVDRRVAVVEVRDPGPRRRPADGADGAGGFGLIGMRERAESLGGTVEAGPSPDGGWTVTARLPVVQSGNRGTP